MHTATAITVLDRAGTHTAVYVPPPSRQPRAVVKASRYDRSAIMTAAWANYRAAVRKGWTKGKFDAARWSHCVSFAWGLAKAQIAKAREEAELAIRLAKYAENMLALKGETVQLSDAVQRRRAEIQNELLVMEMSDCPTDWLRNSELCAELRQLVA